MQPLTLSTSTCGTMSESDTDSLSGLSSRELEEDSNSVEEDDHVDLGDLVME